MTAASTSFSTSDAPSAGVPIDDLALPHVARLHAYTPGLQPDEPGWIKLNTNECPYPPSPRAAEAVRRELGADGASLRLYPSPASAALREAIAAHHGHGLRAENVCVGNGSDDVLNLLVRAFCSPEAALSFTVPSYSLYPVLVAIQDGRAEEIGFERTMRLPVEKIAASPARAFILTSPNAPTGVAFGRAEIERVLAAWHGLLVVDEAYAPFAREDAVPLLARYPNLVVTRTLSKAHALAGIRVGYALAHPATIAILDRVRDSYNVSRLSQAAALAAIGDTAYYDGIIAKIKRTRDRHLALFGQGSNEACKMENEACRNTPGAAAPHYPLSIHHSSSAGETGAFGWFTYPSQANFIFTEPRDARGKTGPAVAAAAYEHLRANKILVRYFPGHPLTASFLRISVGTDAEMAAVHQSLQAWQTNA
ncbi:MAG: aminotransferase class I/II-fold pyridoxal phosphate-dependent enzyme [Opitutaceae bacterium]|jgi:histidinol-phosphate aminotransferase|nr:aminotransferase class I/II-fold pyridoxal phosphate-dependent enzyme [Opitutaceae bacterium]